MLVNDRLLRALHRKPVDKTPVWMMRQAGRYLPEYQALRQSAGDFITLCQNPEFVTEITLQPVRRFELDAAIIFSDILVIPDAMGLGLDFIAGEGPYFQRPLHREHDIQGLRALVDLEDRLHYVMEGIHLTTTALEERIPLIGFAGAPWTLACYMLEGRGGGNFLKARMLLAEKPALMQHLLAVLAESVAAFLYQQWRSGASVLMLFDSWAGLLPGWAMDMCCIDPIKVIVSELRRRTFPEPVPIIVFCKGAGQHCTELMRTGCDALGLDWTTSLGWAKEQTQQRVALQGNLDPAVLLLDDIPAIHAQVDRVLADYGAGPGHIFNLGHGIMPTTPVSNVQCVVDRVHEQSSAFHTGQEKHGCGTNTAIDF